LKLLIVTGLLYAVIFAAVAIVDGNTLRVALFVLAPLFSVLWLMRWRWYWWFAAVGGVISLITDPLEGRSAWLIAWSVFTLVLVLWPSTYMFVTRRPLPSWVTALPGQSGKPGPQA
jgi:hypothetical protein